MAVPQQEPDDGHLTADGEKLPSRLRLAFSKAADNPHISKLFSPAVKSKIDPHDFVVKREKTVFDDAIARGRAAFLYDTATGEVHTLTMAYHVHNGTDHIYTEIGSSLARIAGFKSAQVVVAALVLKEWWQSQPTDMIVTEILPNNGPSLHLYRDTMEWEEITDSDTAAELHRLCNEYIDPEHQGRQTVWFACSDAVLPQMAQILLDYMDKGTLYNRHIDEHIDLDLTALESAGLTRSRLELITRGIVYKPALTGTQPPAPSGPR